jgi:AraC-like DNA-binding protein
MAQSSARGRVAKVASHTPAPPQQNTARVQSFTEKRYRHRGILDASRFAQHVTLRCYEPSAALAPFVELYFVARWDRPGQPVYYATDILTKPVVNLFFTRNGAFYSGIYNSTRTFEIDERGVYAGVKFLAGGFHALFGMPATLTSNTTVPAAEILPQVHDAFTKRLLAHTDDRTIIKTVEDLLGTPRQLPNTSVDRIEHIIAYIDTEQPRTVQEIAASFSMSERTIQHLFQQYVGVGVKWVMMRSRLLKTLEQATLQTRPNWTSIAAGLDYSTQSHFTNDFRQLLGMTPSQYAHILAGKNI